jgi:uncharacterized membrane protein
MERPKIIPRPDEVDKLLEAVGIAGLLLLIGIPIYYYGALPETIPHHYDATGKPDAFGEKGIIWTLPLLGLALFVFLSVLKKSPHMFNYTVKITHENAERQYGMANKMLRAINAITTCGFAYISYGTVQAALGRQDGLGRMFGPVFLILIMGTVVYFTIRSFQRK